MLEDFIAVNEVKAEILVFDEDMSHAHPKLEEKLGAPLVKSILFLIDQAPVLILLRGRDHASRQKLKALFNAGHVHLAEPEEVEEVTGYAVGAVPPISIYGVRTLIDARVAVLQTVVAGGGKKNCLLKIPVSEIQRTAWEPEIQDVAE